MRSKTGANLSPDEFVGRAGDGGLPGARPALLVNVVDHGGSRRAHVTAGTSLEKTE